MIDKEKLASVFERKGFKTSFFDRKESAIEYLANTIVDKKVGIGGSMTAKELGLYDELIKKNQVAWHWVVNDKETRSAELASEVFILSANGVSETGELINIDGGGNRVAASLYGPEKVIYIIGRNKVETSFEKALWRARNIAGVKNAQRFGLNTPCVKGNKCFDCNSPDRICNGFVIVTHPMKGQSVELVFIDEDLGY